MLCVLLALLAALPFALATGAHATTTLTCTNDDLGANDQPGQKDLTKQCSGTPAGGQIEVTWNWDVIKLSGGNTGDACALFDTDNDARVNAALCVTIGGSPAAQLSVSPRLYTCGDSKADRCTSTITQITPFPSTTSCSVINPSNDDPFSSGDSYPKDTRADCVITLSDINSTNAKLVNTCSYPSQSPTSDPSDCVLIPRDAFITIVKSTSPSNATTSGSFDFKLDGGASSVYSTTAAGTSSVIPITTASGAVHNVAEDLTKFTDFTFTTASCSGASDNNGTLNSSTATISGIDARADDNVTCTFTNTQQAAPQLTIEKSCPQGAADNDESFVMKNGSSTLATLQCDASTTVTLTADTAYDVEESAGSNTSLSNYTVDDDSDTDCQNASGLPRGATTPTCTVTNTLKSAPGVTIIKDCPNGAYAGTDQFQPKDGTADAGSAIACGGSTTYNPAPGNAYNITEAAATTTPPTDLGNYTTSHDDGCSGTLTYGQSATCTITNKKRLFTVVAVVCETTSGTPALYKSTVTLPSPGGTPTTTATSPPGSATAAQLCALAANFPTQVTGDHAANINIGTSPAP
jgi:hypothetical protein